MYSNNKTTCCTIQQYHLIKQDKENIMPKAILEFDLNDPDDQMAHLRAIKSLDMALVLWEMAYNAKKSIKYQIEGNNIECPYEAVDKVFEKIWEELNERGINLDDLVN